ncbi:D-aminoacyl-tRNA deacylase [soil metagenome]
MRVVLQRVIQANVSIDNEIVGRINNGLVVFAGIEKADDEQDIRWLAAKIVNLRIFNDENSIPNISVRDAGGDLLLISQFTLHALTKKGNRPSYILAARPETAIPLYENLIAQLEIELGKKIQTGIFGADMQISLINDGPVTIWIDSKQRE